MTALDGILWTEGSTTQQAAEILPWLFVGGKPAASDAMYANSQAFTHVLSTIEPWYADGPNADQITYNGQRLTLLHNVPTPAQGDQLPLPQL